MQEKELKWLSESSFSWKTTVVFFIYPWALFKISSDHVDSQSLLQVLNGIISGYFSCGRTLDFDEYDIWEVATVSKPQIKFNLEK